MKLTIFIKIPHKGLYMKTNKRREPYNPRFKNFAVILFGKRSNKICEPSNGGMGRRLNTNKNTFRNTPYQSTVFIIEFCTPSQFSEIINSINNKTERIRFESGPANETTRSSFKEFLKLFLFTGSGFAQPISAKPDAKEARGMITDPIKSICLIGFNVNLPSFFAVSSPNLFAISA